MRKIARSTVPLLLIVLAACGSSATPAASPTTDVTTAATTAPVTTATPVTTAAPTTAPAATKRTYDVCAMLTADEVRTAGLSGPGRGKTAEKPDHVTSTCDWGSYPSMPGLFITVASYQDRAAVDAVKAQLGAGLGPVSGLGDSAVRADDGINVFKANVVFAAFASGFPGGPRPSDEVLVALLKVVESKL